MCGNTDEESIFLGYYAISIGKCRYYLPTDAALYSRRTESSCSLLFEIMEV
jgi:hypothetical protein